MKINLRTRGCVSGRERSSIFVPHATPEEIIGQRIAKAKRYKEGGSSEQAQQPTPEPTVKNSPSQPLKADYSAFTSFVQGSSKSNDAPGPRQPVGPLSPPPQVNLSQATGGISITQIIQDEQPDATPFLERDGVDDLTSFILNARQEPERGSATVVASSLAGVFSEEAEQATEGIDSSLSMEAFTLARDERMKAKGADMLISQVDVDSIMTPRRQAALDVASQDSTGSNENLTELGMSLLSSKSLSPALDPPSLSDLPPRSVDESTSQASSSSQEPTLYKPKVSTWGSFPRPANISEAYGGGKNIRPGQRLESEEQEKARELSFKLAMHQYREKMGLDVDPEIEAEAEKEYLEGMRLFEAGQLQESYAFFQRALDLVPVRTAVGGKATLQKAVILDSTGNSEEAKKLYKNIRGHAVAAVARKARQLSYGFEAADFLKANTISYATKSKDYIKYFRSIADRNRVFVSSEEDKARDLEMERISSIIALGVILGPLLLVGSIVASKHA